MQLDNKRDSPMQARDAGLRKVMAFVHDFDGAVVAKRELPSQTESEELKEVLVPEDSVHQDETPEELKSWGAYLQEPPAEEKKTVMIFVNRPLEQTSARPLLETQKCGQPVGFLPQQQAPLNVVSLLPDEPKQISAPSLRHVGASYYEGDDGYYYLDHAGSYRRFTDFTIRILAEEEVQTIDGDSTVFFQVKLRNDQGHTKSLRVPAEEWTELASKIERHATAFMVFHDEIHGTREKFKRLISVLLKESKVKKASCGVRGGGVNACQTVHASFITAGWRTACPRRNCCRLSQTRKQGSYFFSELCVWRRLARRK